MDEDTGIIVSQQGVDVAIAADYQKVIDSRWRFLDILNEAEGTISHADSGSTKYWAEKLLDHNLGYLPAFTFRQKALDLGSLTPAFYGGVIIATTKSIYWRNLYVSGDPTTPIKLNYFLRVFSCDISTEYQAPIDLIVPGNPVQEPDVGVKILTELGDIRTPELSQFTVNTRGKAFAIQQAGTRVANSTNSFTMTILHKLGYPPTYFLARLQSAAEFKATTIFTDPIGQDYIFPTLVPAAARITADTNQIVMKGAQSALQGRFAFLITKEPQELAV